MISNTVFATSLHDDYLTSMGGCKSSMILPVLVSHVDNPKKEIMVYGLLDTQTDTTFVSDDRCEKLGWEGPSVRLQLSVPKEN